MCTAALTDAKLHITVVVEAVAPGTARHVHCIAVVGVLLHCFPWTNGTRQAHHPKRVVGVWHAGVACWTGIRCTATLFAGASRIRVAITTSRVSTLVRRVCVVRLVIDP